MTIRTVTSHILNLHGGARVGDPVVFTLVAGTYTGTEHVPADTRTVHVDYAGNISLPLYCPATYHCTIAGTTSFDVVVPDSASAATLEALHVASSTPPESVNALQTLIDSEVATRTAADAVLTGGTTVAASVLKAWTAGDAYQLTAITYDSTYIDIPSTATVVWPDGSTGVFTATTINATYQAIDAYTITHVLSGHTITQAAVTRNTNGDVTVKPALTVT